MSARRRRADMRRLPAATIACLLVVLIPGCVTSLTGASTGADGTAADERQWPDADQAPVRPGVPIVRWSLGEPFVEQADCTSNFVFTSPDNASIYLGTAAHCVETLQVGDEVSIGNGVATGRLAYSSWLAMERTTGGMDVFEEPVCRADVTPDECRFNDFALVRIDDEHRHLVHPAMLHFGGPITLADSQSVTLGAKVLTYGNSALRGGLDPLSWHEGYAVESTDWITRIYTLTPGVPGDSGSGVLTRNGEALGVIATLSLTTRAPGSNVAVNLDEALRWAHERGGFEALLATWVLLDGGVLPDAPSGA